MQLNELNILDIGHSIQLTGAIYSGKGKSFLCYFPGEAMDLPEEQLHMDKNDWDKFIKQTDHLETEILARNPVNGELTKIIVRKSTRQIEQNVSWKVYKRDNYSCRYCGNNDCPLTVDHLVLWEEGGPSTVENLVSACRACNRTRGNMQYKEWLQFPYYTKRMVNLTPQVRDANQSLVATLDSIPRMVHKRAR